MSLNLKVIGAGLGRTGTTSLKEALSTLLNGPCFHLIEFKTRPELMTPWRSFIESMPTASAAESAADVPVSRWETMMPGYVACLDEPVNMYWKQLSRAFPEALVILSVRDVESWCASVRDVACQYDEELKRPDLISEERRKFLDFVDAIFPQTLEEAAPDDRIFFEAHNRQVMDHAEKDESFRKRFLVWQVEDGWEPICSALDLAVPRIPFPHKNKRTEFHGY